MRLDLSRLGRRALVDLCLAFSIGFALLVLSVLINFPGAVHGFLLGLTNFRVTRLLMDGLFVWLVVLLGVCFMRWRAANRKTEELQDVVSSISPDALIMVTPERRIIKCNASVQRVFGYTEEEILNQTTDQIYFDRRTRADTPREIYDALQEDGFHIGIATGKKKDGSTIPLEIITGLLADGGGAVLLLRDITERRRAEEERQRMEEQADRARRLETLGTLSGGPAHEFKNHLMIIHGHTDLLRMSLPATLPIQKELQEIERATDRAAELCRHLRSFSGATGTNSGPMDLSHMARETVRLLGAALADKANVILELRDDLPAVYGDATQIQQVAMNLIANAAEALGPGRGTIIVGTGMCQCDPAYFSECAFAEGLLPGRYVYLRVADNGCGMDGQIQQRIFDPFFTTKATGHGMGLAAALGIVKSHHAGMRVESRPGEGTAITAVFRPGEGVAA